MRISDIEKNLQGALVESISISYDSENKPVQATFSLSDKRQLKVDINSCDIEGNSIQLRGVN